MMGLNNIGLSVMYDFENKNLKINLFRNIESGYLSILTIVLGLFLVFFTRNSFQICQRKERGIIFYILMGFVIFCGISFINKSSQFIYFNF